MHSALALSAALLWLCRLGLGLPDRASKEFCVGDVCYSDIDFSEGKIYKPWVRERLSESRKG